MALVRWRPRRSLSHWDSTWDPFTGSRPTRHEGLTRSWYPTVDIVESEDDVTISAELPGLDREDIKVEVKDDVLTFWGERKQREEQEGDRYRRVERRHGAFRRSFALPSTVSSEDVTATYENGVLSLRLPKAEEAKPREIPVHAG